MKQTAAGLCRSPGFHPLSHARTPPDVPARTQQPGGPDRGVLASDGMDRGSDKGSLVSLVGLSVRQTSTQSHRYTGRVRLFVVDQ